MKIRTFWNIIIKAIGIILLLQTLLFVPQFLSTIDLFYDSNFWLIATTYLLLMLIFLVLIMWVLFVKTNWIIDKLQLDKGFDEEIIDLNASYSKVLGLLIVVIGGFWLINTLPDFLLKVVEIYRFKQNELLPHYATGFSYTPLIFDIIKMILGYLMVTNAKAISMFIQKKNKDN
jgi:hypothetical protein